MGFDTSIDSVITRTKMMAFRTAEGNAALFLAIVYWRAL